MALARLIRLAALATFSRSEAVNLSDSFVVAG